MAKRVVILGGGTGGTLGANRLRKRLGKDVEITVIDQDDHHVYQPGLLFVPFGLAHPEDLVRPRGRQLHRGIEYVQEEIHRVDLETDTVHLANGVEVPYDVLVVATGARLLPEETEGLLGDAWNRKVFTFYEMDSALHLWKALEEFHEGRLVIDIVDLPIKCPVAPLEFAFLADWWLTEHKRRDKVSITYVTPLDGAFTKPVASRTLHGMLDEKGIDLVTEFNTGEVDGGDSTHEGRLISYDEREVPFDLAVVVPLHGGAEFIGRSEGLGDELDFVPTDPKTLQSQAKANVFAIGDATNLPASKAGSVTHFEGETLVENVARFLEGEELVAGFDGHANCFVETGFHKAMLIDFNYEQEPVPGRFPADVGLPLLTESRLNHLGKLMFQWFYWHSLLPGREIPGISSTMPTRGKHLEDTSA